MPRTIKAISKRRKIIFMSNIARQTAPTQSSIDKLGEIAPNEQSSGNVIGALTGRIEEVTDQDDLISYENAEYLFPRSPTMPAEQDRPPVPDLFTSPPPIRDDLVTETSDLQDETVQECLPYLSGTDDSSKGPFDFNPHGLPPLEREKHTAFLHNALRTLPAAYVGYDASRPWILYWALTGLYLLGDDISQYRER
ncbi:CAAX farnesyltransferase (FTase) subunit beta [Hypocenomyce scalaris]|nr:CAAX farnesyltransferase (FTase) subunit beta [Hypocenomyce scalaris]